MFTVRRPCLSDPELLAAGVSRRTRRDTTVICSKLENFWLRRSAAAAFFSLRHGSHRSRFTGRRLFAFRQQSTLLCSSRIEYNAQSKNAELEGEDADVIRSGEAIEFWLEDESKQGKDCACRVDE